VKFFAEYAQTKSRQVDARLADIRNGGAAIMIALGQHTRAGIEENLPKASLRMLSLRRNSAPSERIISPS
jgi:hypothetical protein